MKQVIGGKVYDTEEAILVASDHYWDGSNWDRHGRNTFLYKTQNGNFFLHRTTRWQGERDALVPLSVEEAKVQYELLPVQVLDWQEAFGEVPAEA